MRLMMARKKLFDITYYLMLNFNNEISSVKEKCKRISNEEFCFEKKLFFIPFRLKLIYLSGNEMIIS